jgi:predicted nucleic acid-binding Zn finger protein
MRKDIQSQFIVESFTQGDKKYKVTHYLDGTFGCSCPAWIFQRKKLGDCKHIKAVQSGVSRGLRNGGRIQKQILSERIKVDDFVVSWTGRLA